MPGSNRESVPDPDPLKKFPHASDMEAGNWEASDPSQGHSPKQSPFQDNNVSHKRYQEQSVDKEDLKTGQLPAKKSLPRDANGYNETINFIPGSVESLQGQKVCLPCSGPGRPRCRTVVCCLLTCGLSRVCGRCIRVPCLAPDKGDEVPEKARLESGPPVLQQPRPAIHSSFRYPDVRLAGKKVQMQPRESSPVKRRPSEQRPSVSRASNYSMDDVWDDGSEDGMDIDSLIAKKLLELYTQHQIEQLACCTSDSVFLSRTSQISQLISDIQQEHDLEEQDAECRLVHGIIRLSTRKPAKRGHVPPTSSSSGGQRDETLPDSGNDTMMETTYSFDTDHDVKISEQTSTDKLARDMRNSSRRAPSSGLHASYSPVRQDSEVVSSGTPLLRNFTSV